MWLKSAWKFSRPRLCTLRRAPFNDINNSKKNTTRHISKIILIQLLKHVNIFLNKKVKHILLKSLLYNNWNQINGWFKLILKNLSTIKINKKKCKLTHYFYCILANSYETESEEYEMLRLNKLRQWMANTITILCIHNTHNEYHYPKQLFLPIKNDL